MPAYGLVRTAKLLSMLNPPSFSWADTTHPRSFPISPPSPVPIISHKDLDDHLEVLQSHGWHFHQASRRFDALRCTAEWWELCHRAQFPSFKSAMGYVNDVADLAKTEKHHPTILIFDRVHVVISLDTHDTVERPATFSDSSDTPLVSRWPGVTLRDVRMALLINPLLSRHRVVESMPPMGKSPSSYDDVISVHLKN